MRHVDNVPKPNVVLGGEVVHEPVDPGRMFLTPMLGNGHSIPVRMKWSFHSDRNGMTILFMDIVILLILTSTQPTE